MKSIVFIILSPIYLIYLLIIKIRNFAYSSNIFNTTKLNCKVVSVGNLSMGGAGKTPVVIELAKILQQDHNVAILSRGYGRNSKGTQLATDGKTKTVDWKLVGDEPALMSQKLSSIPIVVDENRVRGGIFLINNFNPDVIILDDAFQHRKLHRDIDIVLINYNRAKRRQFLRESWSSLRRADMILITKAYDSNNVELVKDRILKFNSNVVQTKMKTGDTFIDLKGNLISINPIRQKSTLLVSGIGDPASFTKTVENIGFKISDSIVFKDHQKYTTQDISLLQSKLQQSGAEIILTTEKDIIKLPESALPIYAVPITLNIAHAALKQIYKIFD